MGNLLSLADYERLLGIVAELAEISHAEPERAIASFVERLDHLIGCATVWLSVIRAEAPAPDGTVRWSVERSVLHGLDEGQLCTWRSWWLDRESYKDHPMMVALWRHAGRTRTHRRRDIVDDAAWYASPHIGDFCRALGYDDAMAGVVPLSGEREAIASVIRPWGDRPFSPREEALLAALQPHLAWFHRRHLVATADPRWPELPPRLQPVLCALCTGASEKEIARQRGLSPRTVHKYVEQIYRALNVRSRAELMARFLADGGSYRAR